jgi:GNAT superfamily N-acetyltransferase
MDESAHTRLDDHVLNTELLDAELPERRYVDASYLRWLYDDDPLGPAFFANADEDGQRMAHYAVVPQRYRNASTAARFVFSLHAVTRSTAQRKGYFSTLGEEIYEQARQWGALGVIGVSNDNSTPPVVKRLNFRLLGPLPVRVAFPVGGDSEFESRLVTPDVLTGRWFSTAVDELAAVPARAWTNVWDGDFLRWRLSAPNCGPFAVHIGPSVVAVSTAAEVKGVPVAVLLKLVARHGRSGVSGAPAVAAACRFHGARLAVYAGFNRHVRVRGVQPPRRLQPSPLNLIYRSLSDEAPKETFALDTFEFLDMDAY